MDRDTIIDTLQNSTFEFVRGLQNTNTRHKTESNRRKTDYLTRSGDHRKQQENPFGELDMHLARFFMNAKKASGEDFIGRHVKVNSKGGEPLSGLQ